MRVIVFQSDLQFNGFGKIAFLFLRGELEEIFDILSDVSDRDFATQKQLALISKPQMDTSWPWVETKSQSQTLQIASHLLRFYRAEV